MTDKNNQEDNLIANARETIARANAVIALIKKRSGGNPTGDDLKEIKKQENAIAVSEDIIRKFEGKKNN